MENMSQGGIVQWKRLRLHTNAGQRNAQAFLLLHQLPCTKTFGQTNITITSTKTIKTWKNTTPIRRPIGKSCNFYEAFQYTEGLLPKIRWRRRASVTFEVSISCINRPTPTSSAEQFKAWATKQQNPIIGIHPSQKEKGLSQKRSLSNNNNNNNNNNSNIWKKGTMSSWSWEILLTKHTHSDHYSKPH